MSGDVVRNDDQFDALLREATKHVTPEMLLTYLTASGWMFKRFRLDDNAQEWILGDDDAISVIVPLPSLPNPNDFTRRMRFALRFVSLVEGWPFTGSVVLPAALREEAGDG